MDGTKRRKSFKGRLVRLLGLMLVLAAVGVAALPWLLALPPARNAVVAAVNRSLAPSQVGIRGLSASWYGSCRLTGLTLRDGHGKLLIDARQATIDRGLIALLRNHASLGTITVSGAKVDLERRPDGSIDLVDALVPKKPAAPANAPAPAAAAPTTPTDVTLKVLDGSLKLTTPELSEPLTASKMDMEVRVPAAAGEKLAWKIRLAGPAGGEPSATLGVDGDYDYRAAADPDLSLVVKGERWPLAVANAGVAARARLDGSLAAQRAAGLWTSTGDAKLLNLDASGGPLQGDRLAFDAVSAGWDLAQAADAWSIRRLGVVTPVGTLSANGSLASSAARGVPDARVEARVDLAALARQLPHALHVREGLVLEHGSARVLVQVKKEGDAQKASVEAQVSDLTARDPVHTFTLRDPASLSGHATRTPSGVTVETIALKSAFVELTGSGDLDRGVKLTGSLDLGKIEEQFRELVDFRGLKLAGNGRMAADYRRQGATYVGRFAAEARGLKVAGVSSEPIDRDTLRFDVAANGPAESSGLPQGWENLRVNLKSTRDALALAATRRDGVTAFTAAAATPVPTEVSARPGQADLKVAGRWKPGPTPLSEGLVEFEEFRLALRPNDPALAGGTFALAARGTLDLDADDLALTPLPLAPGLPTGVAIAPEGLKLHGLRKTPLAQRAAKLALVGDLGALERALFVWKAREPSGLGGAFTLSGGVGPGEAGKLNLALTLNSPDLTRLAADGKTHTSEGAVTLAYSGSYDPAADRLGVGAVALVTRYARIDAAGLVDQPTGPRLADLRGTLAPNWATVSTMAADALEPNARLDGKPRPFRLKGPLSGDSLAAILKGLDTEVALEITSANAFGLRLGAAPIVIRGKGGAFTVDPIESTLNNGKVSLKPGLTVDDVQGIAVTLAQGSAITGAEINDEVSRKLLTYVAPVLDDATHVNGKVSMTFDRAEIPVTGPPTKRLNLIGQLTFQDVIFAPGPFARQVLTLVGDANEPGLKLHQPVELSIADGRVTQKGLEVPIRNDAKVALEGSVGFDQTLALVATVPITRGMLGSRSGLNKIIGDSRVQVPIGGTVKNPRINKQALQVALKELTRNVLNKELSSQASGLLDRLGVPADAAGGNAAGGIPTDSRSLEDAILKRLAPRPRGGNPARPRTP